MLGMLLLARRLLVFVENPVDKLLHRTPFRLLPLGSLTLRRNRILKCLAHHAEVHLMLLSQLVNRLSRRVAAADHLEQLQFGSPFHLGRMANRRPAWEITRSL